MSGINVPQYQVFKLSTKKLKYHGWNMNILKHDAMLCGELVSLFEGQEFRLIADILGVNIREIDFSNYILVVEVENHSDFMYVVENGVTVNENHFQRFVGTPNGLKHNTLLFVNGTILDELNKRCNCGRKDIPIIPSKLEAYKSLTCSASQPICSPNGILVVPDCLTHIYEDVIKIEDDVEPRITYEQNVELENNVTDGFSICTIEYMVRIAECLNLNYVPGGVCLRNAWFKGMLYPFPIMEFFEKYYGKDTVTDIWGNEHNIKDIEMITTESSFKLYKAYDNIDEYVRLTKENGYTWAVTKIAPKKLEDERELNYQYLQSYEFEDEDIEKLCAPTIRYLKDALCGDYESTINFLGINDTVQKGTWQEALYVCPKMLDDPFVIESVYRMIRKKIDLAKIGKLKVHGNYQIVSGDPFMLMESVCGLEPKGLLHADQVYSDYWLDEDVKEIVIFRSPMTAHNDIRKCAIGNSPEMTYWYQYMNGIIILNGWDTICQALNGCDYDGDILFTTNNEQLIKKYKRLPVALCVQQNAEKIIPTEKDIANSNWNGMGNKVGTITNRITSMMEVQSRFEKGSAEYEKLAERIISGKKHQQDEIDKLKGIIAEPMPKHWYDYHKCSNDFDRKICADKKPYFMIYIYEDYKTKYNKYIKEAYKTKKILYGDNEPDAEFIDYYNRKMPFGMGNCAMNRICWYIEQEFEGIVIKRKSKSTFDYTVIKKDIPYSSALSEYVIELNSEYIKLMKNYSKNSDLMEKGERTKTLNDIKKYIKAQAKKIIPDEEMLCDIVLDLIYTGKCNRAFGFELAGNIIVSRLKGEI